VRDLPEGSQELKLQTKGDEPGAFGPVKVA